MPKSNVINTTIALAAEIIADKIAQNEMIIGLIVVDRGMDDPTACKLINQAARMQDAVDLMNQLKGCWS